MKSDKLVFSATQCTSRPHLGNYLGAIRNWVDLQDSHECIFMAADLNSITIQLDPASVRKHCLETLAYFLGSGISLDKSTVFIQSMVPQHLELAWVFICNAYMGELSRMTQFKDKSQRQGVNVGAGIFAYPTLMAADILMYRAHLVPVGDDQKQHLEITRDLAQRWNQRYQTDLFVMPEAMIRKENSRVMDLQDPDKKMSKSSESHKGVVFLDESNDQIAKKFRAAKTDSGSEIVPFAEASLAVQNLLDLASGLSRKAMSDIESEWVGKSYGAFKVGLADLAVSIIEPIRNQAQVFLADEKHLISVIREGSKRASQIAQKTTDRAYETMGFIRS